MIRRVFASRILSIFYKLYTYGIVSYILFCVYRILLLFTSGDMSSTKFLTERQRYGENLCLFLVFVFLFRFD